MLLNPDAGNFVPAANIDERGYRLAALRYSLEAARMKTAARRWIQGARDFALQDDALTRFFNEGVSNRHGGEDGPGIKFTLKVSL